MEYKNINEVWEEYKSQIREPFADLRQLERVFRDGYIRGFENSAKTEIRRLEIINHNTPSKEIGRLLVHRGDIEVQLQDDGKTLKVYI